MHKNTVLVAVRFVETRPANWSVVKIIVPAIEDPRRKSVAKIIAILNMEAEGTEATLKLSTKLKVS